MLPEIIKSCNSQSGLNKEVASENNNNNKSFSLGSDSDDDEEGDLLGVDVDVNFIDEKSAAVHAIGNICLNCTGKTMEKMEEILACLDELGFYFHENIRYHVCMTYT